MNPARSALRILLAEDNPGDVFLVKEALTKHSVDCELIVANDGQEAWQLIEAEDRSGARGFDICLLDLNLPGRPGVEIAARIRRCGGDLSRALIILVTSSTWTQDRNAAGSCGADYYFCKPSHLDGFLELGSVIRSLWTDRQIEPGPKARWPAAEGDST
jgi:chemotaxis family two-component system response regulator Rcp1